MTRNVFAAGIKKTSVAIMIMTIQIHAGRFTND